ncbi:glutamine synthetase [Gregarina niphandrodes]|uniref:Lengsin n=1 Tax=Gregarina niphandrodes TaxID=110365 RepID=A0A023B2J3_GRENI|nr:glutamine synthetase [Gregarina niphandrodes]EZG55040.1 glutamine synthetase [Gregarina niphandrodes]|eukprot:XP_011131807.1 glutamine synthetase [Gregarina niphandrodes]
MSEDLAPMGPKPSLHRAILKPVASSAVAASTGAAYDTPEGGVVEDLRLEFGSPAKMVEFLATHPRIRFVDICFNDPIGQWHHCTFSAEFITEENLRAGYGFDASSIPMFEKIENSDFVMVPDVSTCFLDPFAHFPTLQCVADIATPLGSDYEKCPRRVLKRAVDYLRKSGAGEKVYFGPEAEFFVFNDAEFYVNENCVGYSLNGDEAYWNGKGGDHNLAHRAQKKQGYMTSRPMDRMANLRSEMLLVLQQLGINTEKHHHEVATCQMELNVHSDDALRAADHLMMLKYVVRNVANRRGKTATFMPKPLACDNGSGMHCNQSVWKNGENVFFDPEGKFMELSDLAVHYMAGILHHCKALLAFSCPTTNSYKRLVPDFEAPVHITYSAGNRSTAIRVPSFASKNSKRIEFRMPDASCSPYLAFASQVMAGLDGIQRKLELPLMGSGNLFDENNPCLKYIERAPHSLEGALDALQKDHDFLLQGAVFSENFIQSFIKFKRKESSQMNGHPHPREFQLYYGI